MYVAYGRLRTSVFHRTLIPRNWSKDLIVFVCGESLLMETKTLLILLAVVVVYVLIGGAIMYGIEHSNELATQTSASSTYVNFTGGIHLKSKL